MKITVRTLYQKTVLVEMDDTQNVMDLKERLVASPDIAIAVDRMQLIYGGRILEDNETLGSCNFDENKFMVLMSKRKVDVTLPVADSVATTPLAASASSEISNTTTEPPLLANTLSEELVRVLMNMGYSENDVRAALRGSFGHRELVVEYPNNSTGCTIASTHALGSDQSLGDRLLHQNPELLTILLDRLNETDAQSGEIIRNNQEEFSLINQDPEDMDTRTSSEMAMDVQLTSQELEAVDRLTALGFNRELVLQVYFACDKNEEVAADILFQQSEEDHNQ